MQLVESSKCHNWPCCSGNAAMMDESALHHGENCMPSISCIAFSANQQSLTTHQHSRWTVHKSWSDASTVCGCTIKSIVVAYQQTKQPLSGLIWAQRQCQTCPKCWKLTAKWILGQHKHCTHLSWEVHSSDVGSALCACPLSGTDSEPSADCMPLKGISVVLKQVHSCQESQCLLNMPQVKLAL